jgi:hypothetical protein
MIEFLRMGCAQKNVNQINFTFLKLENAFNVIYVVLNVMDLKKLIVFHALKAKFFIKNNVFNVILNAMDASLLFNA